MEKLTLDEKIQIGHILMRMTSPLNRDEISLREKMIERGLIDVSGNLLPDGIELAESMRLVAVRGIK